MEKYVATLRADRQRRYCSQIQYCLIVLLVPMMIFLLGAVALTTQAYTNSQQFQTQQIPSTTQQKICVLGETFKLGNLQYKINSVRTFDGDGDVEKSPRQGNTFLLVDLTIENQGNADAEVRSMLGFKLRDNTGKSQSFSIGAALAVKDAIDGTIKAGEKMSGELGYEVLKGAQTFELVVIPDPLSTNKRIATIKIPVHDQHYAVVN
ncbi:hypothetical protein JCM17380_33500 [Desulfosporosinus burensis]